ncbi:TonB-dependent receptor plug [Chloroherpeton thalassium ATCC 35110]|uniref:TonB-dependent receptor plug n=1 Tax=Chloroherpeton thalassium (strain ATCC 35110 / GB-78) TaxID=517418 RepID=B3QW07_CHLT3|nr:TonB-dependent receptor [Chloroherpeton thalassium]ACF14661.1 TonB-dependent receptor plug [Chloroherpeton thalassium ATCC 35110]
MKLGSCRKRNWFKPAVLSALVLATNFGSTGTLRAEEKELDPIPEKDGDEIVVTATRMADSSFNVPVSIEQISQKQLQSSAPESIGEVLRDVPGVSMAGSGLWDVSPIIRGFSGNRVLVLIDGNRENNLWAGRDPLTPFLDVSQIERIEVLKGASSVLYGTDALGGVINIITKKNFPNLSEGWVFKPSAQVGYSSVDEGKFGKLSVQGGGHGFDFQIAASRRETDSYTDGDGNTVANSQFEAGNYTVQAGYMISNQHQLSFSYRRSDIDDKGIPQKENASYSHFTKFDTDAYNFSYQGCDLGFVKELQVKSWVISQERAYDGNIASTTQPMYTLKTNQIETGAVGSSMQVQFVSWNQHTLVAGIEFVHEDAESDELQIKKKTANNLTAKTITFPPVSDAIRNHFSLYAQDKYQFESGALLLAGARYDFFSSDAEAAAFKTVTYGSDGETVTKTTETESNFHETQDHAVTFNLGYLHPLSKQLHFTANFASGFRAPDIFERFSTRGGSYIILGDPDLDAEYSYNIDLGLKLKSQHFNGAVSVFYSWVKNYIDLVDTGEQLDGFDTKTYVNVDATNLYGADASIAYRLNEQLSFFANAAYVLGKNTESDDHLNDIPPLNGMLGTRWENQLNETWRYWFEFNTELYAQQNDPAPGEASTPGYVLLNLRSGIRFSENATLSLAVDNLLDKAYRSHLNEADFLYEPGINFKTTLSVGL